MALCTWAGAARVSLNRALAEQAGRLAAEAQPACYELSAWLAEELPGFVSTPPPRPPPMLLSAKELAEKRRRRLLSAGHHTAAQTATKKMEVLEAEAAAAGQTLSAYMRATNQYPMTDPEANK